MPLTAGTRLGVYEVTAQIGVGGMGEVYRARDTKHAIVGVVDSAQTPAGALAAARIEVVLNWFEELKARVPAK